MNKALLSISVVICAYTEDRWEDLVAAVNSVVSQTRAAEQLVVVIDHNPSLLSRARAQFPQAIVVANNETNGLSGARNSGISAARGDIVAFLDDDAVAAPDWLAQLITGYGDPQVVGIGGSIEPNWPEASPSWFPKEFAWVVGCTYVGMPLQTSPVRNLIGANMSFRREPLVELGSFRSGIGRVGTFPAGCEETELCIRAKQRWPKAVVLYNPAAQVMHHVSANRAAAMYFATRCYAEGLSKALVSRSVGADDALSSERTYVTHVLPKGILRGIAEVLRGDLTGLARAAAILAGLALTTAGYLAGQFAARSLPVVESKHTSEKVGVPA